MISNLHRNKEAIKMSEQVIGFVGTGVMGQGMVKNLLKKGYRVNIHTRTKVKATQLIAEGAEWMYSIKELSHHSDVIITMVGTPEDVEAVYFGNDGLIENAKQQDRKSTRLNSSHVAI